MNSLSDRLSGMSPEKRALLAMRLQQKARQTQAEAAIPRAPELVEAPLSYAQERFWFLQRFNPSPVYNDRLACRLSGPFDREALRAGLEEIVRRHAVLRSTIQETEQGPVQRVGPPERLELPRLDLSAIPESVRESAAAEALAASTGVVFDLERTPAFRVLLVEAGQDEHILAVTLHHIVTDGWSWQIFLRELAALYAAFSQGRPSPLPELPIQYGDFARWQRRQLADADLERQLAYWRDRLAGMSPVLDLPLDRPRPARQTYTGAVRAFAPSARIAAGLRELARQQGVTPFMVLLAAFQALLRRSCRQDDIAVGSPILGRVRPETETLIGVFVNTLVFRIRIAGDPDFVAALATVRQIALEAYAHQDLPFEKLVEALDPERNLSHAPLVQVTFGLQGAAPVLPPLTGLEITPLAVEHRTTRYDLGLELEESSDGGLYGRFQYNSDLFDPHSLERLGRHFEILLEGIVDAPFRRLSELPWLTVAERHELTLEWNDTAVDREPGLLHERIFAQATLFPEAVAVACEGRSLTYGELARRAGRLARRLQAFGLEPEGRVGVAMSRSPELVVALLAILRAGGAYVSLDPAHPADRLDLILADSGTRLLLTDVSLADAFRREGIALLTVEGNGAEPEMERAAVPPPARPEPESLAYVMYTSGSTGRPKGVEISHGAVANFLTAMRRELSPGPGDVWLAVTTVSFDISILEIFLPLWVGAQVELVSREVAMDGPRLAAALESAKATFLQATPATWQLLFDSGWQGREGLSILCGGEALPRPLADRLAGSGAAAWNLYGPTEATVWASLHRISTGGGPVPIGRPIEDMGLRLLDEHLEAVPIGVAGEVCLAGIGLARGYRLRPELTAERFVPDPWSDRPGARLYRTGDLARYRPEGTVEFLGRNDHQVKIRGFRIELGEIEHVLRRHGGVRQAVVVASGEPPAGPRLVAYVVPAGGALVPEELRGFAAARLPEYMVPAVFVELLELPLTPNGKVDRKALLAPSLAPTKTRSTPPRTPIEQLLAGLWTRVLGIESIGTEDHFFALGGHSLLATRVVARLREALGVELPVRVLFEAPTLGALARRVEEAWRGDRGEDRPPLVRVSRDGDLPLSFAQQRLWLLDRLDPNGISYNLPIGVRLRGRLDRAALAAALSELVRRHEGLRTTFEDLEGRAVLRIHPLSTVPLPLLDLKALPEAAARAAASEAMDAVAYRPFDLARGPVFLGALLSLAEQEHLLLLNHHHIVSDGGSMQILVQELAALYGAFVQGLPSPLPELPLQYVDWAAWQRNWLTPEVLDRQLAFWRRQLAGAPPSLELPTDRPRQASTTNRGAIHRFVLPGSLSAGLADLSRSRVATLFMTMLSGFEALLGRISGQTEFTVGTPITGRPLVETEGLIGMFVNTLALRADCSANPRFLDLLSRTRDVCLDAYAHQDLPLERLVEDLQPERSLGRSPLFQVLLVLQNAAPEGAIELPGLLLEQVRNDPKAVKFELSLNIERGPDGTLQGGFEHSTELFDKATIVRLAGHFGTLLEGVVADPSRRLSELPLLTPAERQELLEWNATDLELPLDLPAHRLFEQQVRRSPDAVAAVEGERRATYQELDRLSSGVARRLGRAGVEQDEVVPVLARRGIDFLCAVLGLWKAGGAYLPLDPHHPPRRHAQILASSRARRVIASCALEPAIAEASSGLAPAPAVLLLEDLLQPGPAGSPRAEPLLPKGLAYVIYTSGSTGTPKGAMVEQSGMVNHLWAKVVELGLGERDVVAQTASQCFDISVWQLIAALLVGGRVEIVPDEVAHDPVRLLDALEEAGVTVFETVPSMMRSLLDEVTARGTGARGLSALRWLIPTGEELFPQLCRAWVAAYPEVPVLNAYGPTECSDDVSHAPVHEAPPAGALRIPIGRPVPNLRLHVVGAGVEPLPVGVAGELLVGGRGVGRGYLHEPARTAGSFVPDPFGERPGERLYRTGDRVRRRTDGSLEFLGRLDHQVKVRGFRIEPGEVEAALLEHPRVAQAVVLVRDLPGSGPSLVAYLVGVEGAAPIAELRGSLRGRLPEYMLPAAIVSLAALPLTPNGKVDRKALPLPERTAAETATAAALRTATEEMLVGLWRQILRIEHVGVHDSFFELGGHSLLATQLASRIRTTFRIELPLREIFEEPTVAGLASRVDRAIQAGSSYVQPPIVPEPRHGDLPLSFAQQRLWFLYRLDPESPAFNILTALRIEGPLDVAAFTESLNEVVRRHEILRTVFDEVGGEQVQRILPEVALPLPRIDLSDLSEEHRNALVRQHAEDEARRPFDLRRTPLLRAVLLRLAPEEHALLFTMHHIVSDAWSLRVLIDEVAALYAARRAGTPSPLLPLPIQYADFALWQRRWLAGEALEAHVRYWTERLQGAPPRLTLPGDRPRPSIPSVRGATLGRRHGRRLADDLERMANQEGVTVFMLVLSAFAALLRLETGQSDLVIGTDIANRNRGETEGLIGFFINQLALRLDLSGVPAFGDLLRQAREVTLGAYTHQDLPFEKLVDALRVRRDLSYAPVFQIKINHVPELPVAGGTSGELTITSLPIDRGVAQLDLIVNVLTGREGVSVVAEYSTDLFGAPTVARLLDGFETVLRFVLESGPGVRLNEIGAALEEAERRIREQQETQLKSARLRRFRDVRRRATALAAVAAGLQGEEKE